MEAYTLIDIDHIPRSLKPRRHSKKHIVQLYEMLQDGYEINNLSYKTHKRSFLSTMSVSKNTFLLNVKHSEDERFIFKYDSFEDFLDIMRQFPHIPSPTYLRTKLTDII